jgi:hypothetical protein
VWGAEVSGKFCSVAHTVKERRRGEGYDDGGSFLAVFKTRHSIQREKNRKRDREREKVK